MSDDAPVVYKVPNDIFEKIRTDLRESAELHPDTSAACAIIVQLYHKCATIMRTETIPLSASAEIKTSAIAALHVYGVPLLSSVACEAMRKAWENDTIASISCIFVDRVTKRGADKSDLKIEFWRSSVQSTERKKFIYMPPVSRPLELAATPKWDADNLNIDGAEFATDRQRILDVMMLVRDMHEEMPIGIETSIDLIKAEDFYTSKGKRKRHDSDERTLAKRQNGGVNKDGTKQTHIAYCLIFQHPVALPNIDESFLEHVREKIGAAFMNWVVLFPDTKAIPGSTTEVCRRGEALAIIIKKSTMDPEDVVPFTISGAHWLVKKIEKTE